MPNHAVTTVKYRGAPDDVLASVEALMDTIDSTTAVLFAPPIFVGDSNYVTAYIVYTDDS